MASTQSVIEGIDEDNQYCSYEPGAEEDTEGKPDPAQPMDDLERIAYWQRASMDARSRGGCSNYDSNGQVTLTCGELWSSSPASTWYSDLLLWIWRVVDYIRLAIVACTPQFSYLWKMRT